MQFTNLEGTLKNLCLTLFVEQHQAEAERCEKEGIDHVGYLMALARGEWERRQHQRIERLLCHVSK